MKKQLLFLLPSFLINAINAILGFKIHGYVSCIFIQTIICVLPEYALHRPNYISQTFNILNQSGRQEKENNCFFFLTVSFTYNALLNATCILLTEIMSYIIEPFLLSTTVFIISFINSLFLPFFVDVVFKPKVLSVYKDEHPYLL